MTYYGPPPTGQPVWLPEPAPAIEPHRHAAPRRNRRTALIVAVVVLAGIIGSAAWFFTSSTSTMTITGVLSLQDVQGISVNGDANGNGCYGSGGYSDIGPGANVVISNASGATIGVGEITGYGVYKQDSCDLPFTVKGVPTGNSFYGVSITHRGIVQFTNAQIKAGPVLTLGG